MPLHAEYVRPPFEANGFDNAVRRCAPRRAGRARGIDRLVMDRDDVAAGHARVELAKPESAAHSMAWLCRS